MRFLLLLVFTGELCSSSEVVVTIEPRSVNVAEGDSVNFTCTDPAGGLHTWLLTVEYTANDIQHTILGEIDSNSSLFTITAVFNSTVDCTPIGVQHNDSDGVAILNVQGM